jgi:ribosome-associated toxin RatA of RatAB toxin-antitoxin module
VTSWHPGVASADLLSERPTGLHAARRCNFHDGTNVREEVIDVEEGRRVRMRLSEFSLPMKRLEAEFSVATTPAGRTEVTFAIYYEAKWGVLGQVMGALVVRRQLAAMARKVLAGLDHHMTTGETVGRHFVPAPA